jgi:hypothetical protein
VHEHLSLAQSRANDSARFSKNPEQKSNFLIDRLGSSAFINPVILILDNDPFSEVHQHLAPVAERSPQRPVISIRISEEFRERFEQLKRMMALRSGKKVLTPEAAKLLLESAKDTCIEVVGLLLQPIESLLRVRKKLEEWVRFSQPK